ncbi:hypothetical protein BDD12DRAFT_368440 [Trichophaea hybrida]|nr:hypothetical protein BDD12DRAFT_368440 [Trichophaea hybrida]
MPARIAPNRRPQVHFISNPPISGAISPPPLSLLSPRLLRRYILRPCLRAIILSTSPSTLLPPFILPPLSFLHPRVSSMLSSMSPSTQCPHLLCVLYCAPSFVLASPPPPYNPRRLRASYLLHTVVYPSALVSSAPSSSYLLGVLVHWPSSHAVIYPTIVVISPLRPRLCLPK